MMTLKQDIERSTLLTRAYHNYAKGMGKYSFFKVHNQAMGDDLVQDTFMKTWGYLVKGGKIVMMKAFLYHILNALIVDEYRKHKTVSLDTLLDKGYEPGPEDNQRVFNMFDGKVALMLIKDVPVKYQKVLKMRYAQGLSIKEIALITNQSRNAVAVQMHRGLEKIKILYNRTKK